MQRTVDTEHVFDQKGGKHGDSGSAGDGEPKKKEKLHRSKSHSDDAKNSTSEIYHLAHQGEKSFNCDTCGKTFKFKSILNTHLRIHTGEKPFTCEICGKAFSQRSNIAVHMRIHTGERPLACRTCGKTFKSHLGLKLHMRTHTGEKPFTCQICGKTFMFHSDLKRKHENSHR
uniref:C2H2-type domain-containing protein n=1 Tax=Sparus aurata TaxID=8175 RepID=A0A671TFA5_SPAAU